MGLLSRRVGSFGGFVPLFYFISSAVCVGWMSFDAVLIFLKCAISVMYSFLFVYLDIVCAFY